MSIKECIREPCDGTFLHLDCSDGCMNIRSMDYTNVHFLV